jgi:hypothetical protein
VTLSWALLADAFADHDTAVILFPEPGPAADGSTDWDVHHSVLTGFHHRVPKVANRTVRLVSNILHTVAPASSGPRCMSNVVGGVAADFIGNFWKQGPHAAPSCEILAATGQYSEHNRGTAFSIEGTPSLYLSGNLGRHGSVPSRLVFAIDPTNHDEWPALPLRNAGLEATFRNRPLPELPLPVETYPVGPAGAGLATLLLDATARGDAARGKPWGPAGASGRLDCQGHFVDARDLFDRGAKVRYEENSIFEPKNPEDARYVRADRSADRDAARDSRWSTVRAALGPGAPCLDSDGDGMPDAWEDAWGLDKDDPSDAWGLDVDPMWSNLEAYLSGMRGR